jgi:phosphoglycolate phosphatase
MAIPAPTIVLFDMDGTTVRHINPQLLNILEGLDDMGFKIAKFCSSLFKRKIKHVPLVEFHEGKRKKLLVHRAMHKIRRKDVDQIVEPCPGIYDVLEFLKENKIRMGLISNGLGSGYGHDVLSTFDLEDYYEVTLFREDLTRAKPHPEPLLQALDGFKKKPGKKDVVWYFGDRQKDIIAALAADEHSNCEIVPFAYNVHAAIAILKHNLGPDHIIMAWPDLLARLENMLKVKRSAGLIEKALKRSVL